MAASSPVNRLSSAADRQNEVQSVRNEPYRAACVSRIASVEKGTHL